MKSFKYITMGLAMAGAMSFSSCASDFLDTIPTADVSTSLINQSLDNLYFALNGIHREQVSQESGSQGYGGEPGFMIAKDCSADDVTWLTNTWYKSANLNWQANASATNSNNARIWRVYYQWVMNANLILEGLENVEVGAGQEKLYNQIKGEALTFRAYGHFQVVQLWADRYVAGGANTHLGIPYRLDSKGGELARSTCKETYDYILADLDEAASLLAGIEVNDVNHFTETFVWGLKSRVALAMQDYANAAAWAEKAIQLAEANGNELMGPDDLMNGFADITTKTKEAIYAAKTQNDQTVYFYSFYANMSWNFSSTAIRQGVKSINADTYDTMSETDLRRQWWDPTGEMAVPLTSFVKNKYQNRKFTARATSDAVGDVAFMRLAELYLNLAEAYARGGNDAKAQEVFTKFQVTRDPAYAGNGNTGAALAEEIMNSRRVELWGEGFRYTDLKRLNLDLVRGRNFDIAFCGFLEKKAGEKGWTWEIPNIETNYNPLCETNY
ncbi:MAG: RagB/SusD family nutrient uptake outer membrane protein [Bacteroidaceae bacterium]|nr:RagB/SusD family nutrient uptake outer membrane protein [Bacteroidaceae bacterium]